MMVWSIQNRIFLPNNTVLLVTLGKFEPNHVLVNIKELKPYMYVDPNESTL